MNCIFIFIYFIYFFFVILDLFILEGLVISKRHLSIFSIKTVTLLVFFLPNWLVKLSDRSDQLLSRVRLFATPWIAAFQASLSITNSRSCCPLSQWCRSTISSVIAFSSCPQSFPVSGSFLVSQFFTSGGQSIGVLVSASVLPMNIQDWFPLGSPWISLQSKGLSRVFSNTTVQN